VFNESGLAENILANRLVQSNSKGHFETKSTCLWLLVCRSGDEEGRKLIIDQPSSIRQLMTCSYPAMALRSLCVALPPLTFHDRWLTVVEFG
jgi:hypothetical protein